jgi:O-antigen ligase
MVRWQCAWELIRSSPWIGHGTGMELGLLKAKYLDHHLYIAYKHDLNAHNQYLSLWIKTGFIGLLFYLFLLGAGFALAFRTKDPFLAAFLMIIAFVSFSENILDVNKGIFFFSFFFSLFFRAPGEYFLWRDERLPAEAIMQ